MGPAVSGAGVEGIRFGVSCGLHCECYGLCTGCTDGPTAAPTAPPAPGCAGGSAFMLLASGRCDAGHGAAWVVTLEQCRAAVGDGVTVEPFDQRRVPRGCIHSTRVNRVLFNARSGPHAATNPSRVECGGEYQFTLDYGERWRPTLCYDGVPLLGYAAEVGGLRPDPLSPLQIPSPLEIGGEVREAPTGYAASF
eukprot:gene45175-26220_t